MANYEIDYPVTGISVDLSIVSTADRATAEAIRIANQYRGVAVSAYWKSQTTVITVDADGKITSSGELRERSAV